MCKSVKNMSQIFGNLRHSFNLKEKYDLFQVAGKNKILIYM